MANAFFKDIYGRSTWKVQAYWDEEFVSRDPQFKLMALDLRKRFQEVEAVIEDISDELTEPIVRDISEFMIYPCSFTSERPEGEKPDLSKLTSVYERSSAWYDIVEQLFVKHQIQKKAYICQFEPDLSPEETLDSINVVVVQNNFKPEKFSVVIGDGNTVTVRVYSNALHTFYVHAISSNHYFCHGRVTLDDFEIFNMTYDLDISWSNVLECFLSWLRNVSSAVALETSGNFIRMLISKGESKHLEFKSTLSYDLKERQSKTHIEQSALKTIAAFLNSEGGTLLIGVEDNGNIHGLEDDFRLLTKKSDPRDGLKQKFDNLIKNSFGAGMHRIIHLVIEELEDKQIAKVVVRRSSSPVFLGTEFFIRANASSLVLSGNELVRYLREHWRD